MAHRGKTSFLAVAGAAVALVAVASCDAASAQSLADHFRGKTVKILVPSTPGGDRALYPVVFARYFGKHIPGNPTIQPVFMPGAGGSTSVNNVYSIAAPDGLTLVTPLVAVITAQAVGEETVKYDVAKLNWIGRIADATRVLMMASKANVRTILDLRSRQAIVGANGRASETYLMPAFMNYVFKTRFKIVNGYQSAGKRNLAIETGELDGAITTWNDVRNFHLDRVREGGPMRLILQVALAKHRELPDLPLLLDYAASDADRELVTFMSSSSQIGQAYATSPGTPAPVVEALRRAFDATMADPSFIERMQTARMEFGPITGEELTAIVMKTIGAPKAVVERYKVAVAGD